MMIGGGKVRDVTELNSVVIRHPLSFTIPKCSCNTKVQSVGPTISGVASMRRSIRRIRRSAGGQDDDEQPQVKRRLRQKSQPRPVEGEKQGPMFSRVYRPDDLP